MHFLIISSRNISNAIFRQHFPNKQCGALYKWLFEFYFIWHWYALLYIVFFSVLFNSFAVGLCHQVCVKRAVKLEPSNQKCCTISASAEFSCYLIIEILPFVLIQLIYGCPWSSSVFVSNAVTTVVHHNTAPDFLCEVTRQLICMLLVCHICIFVCSELM